MLIEDLNRSTQRVGRAASAALIKGSATGMPALPLVIHIPHASTVVPPEALEDFTATPVDLSRFIGLITDHFTDDLFNVPGDSVTPVKHEISRVVVDPERFEDDLGEPMAARGYGVLYERGHEGLPIRPRLAGDRRRWLLDRWYRPHHARLQAAVRAALEAAGTLLIIDAHSFPDQPMPFDLDQRVPRPDACIGTCGMHTPPALVEAARSYCRQAGWSLGVDEPYAGTIVPLEYLGRNPGVMSIMIEINRARYMRLEGNVAVKAEGYAATARFCGELVAAIRSAAACLKESSRGRG